MAWDAPPPAQPAPPPPPAVEITSQSPTAKRDAYVAAGAGLAAIVGALLPWASFETIFGEFTKAGMEDGGDGLVTAGLGLIGGLAALAAGRALIGSIVCGLLITAIAVYDIVDISGADDDLDGGARVSVGAGLYLTVAAGVIMFAAAAAAISQQRKAAVSRPRDERSERRGR